MENPRDGGAWWASVYGVAQSRTQLKRLSSSSSLEGNVTIVKKKINKSLEILMSKNVCNFVGPTKVLIRLSGVNENACIETHNAF